MGREPDFETWYRQEQPRLVRAMWAMSGDRELAADVVEEAFSRALARCDRVSRMDAPGGWVRMVAVNLVRRSVRRRALEAKALFRRGEPRFPEAPTPDVELWAAVQALPLRQREVIALRYLADYTEAGTAAALGISEGATSASLAKARRRLAEALDCDRKVTTDEHR